MKAKAYAKVNLGLQIRRRDTDGYHPLRGVFQTIDWNDDITVEDADEDAMEVPGGGAPGNETNLAWRAVAAARNVGTDAHPTRVVLTKRIPSPAGLGGGSADAAAALNLAAGRFSASFDDVRRIAVDLGSDVPFAIVG
ncbi:MAG: 4-(cytidine 5'-diphospho)-2-C-methyl-D-erythritol kinase, partial [Actinomycetota bacterium]|nr:4-(cytidine 5'-diphospho)-2-C-methyl-D-erythritol kinase [Actinomycetota bacterium]